jgi:hypothetical protein
MISVLQEEVRSKLAALEVGHQNEIQRTISAFVRLQKYAESRKEIDRRLDVHFQRRMYVPLRMSLAFIEVCDSCILQIPERKCVCFNEILSISSTIPVSKISFIVAGSFSNELIAYC